MLGLTWELSLPPVGLELLQLSYSGLGWLLLGVNVALGGWR